MSEKRTDTHTQQIELPLSEGSSLLRCRRSRKEKKKILSCWSRNQSREEYRWEAHIAVSPSIDFRGRAGHVTWVGMGSCSKSCSAFYIMLQWLFRCVGSSVEHSCAAWVRTPSTGIPGIQFTGDILVEFVLLLRPSSSELGPGTKRWKRQVGKTRG